MEEQLIQNFTMCKPVYKIINNTMNYFCDYMVTSMVNPSNYILIDND